MNKKLIRKMLTAAGGPLHYSRTMTTDNLSKAANYVGEYVLKGLGTLGKIMTAPLTGGPLGSATVVLPKTKELLDAEKKIKETQELLIGRASTWLSPLNYGTALVTGNGLNARKGEEKVASWSPAWQAVGRLGELYVGPKVVKGVKATPKVVVNTAAKAGVKPAKAAVVAREIKLATKNKPKYTRVPSKNLFRTQVYKGGEITDPYSNFVTTDPLYASNYGKVTPYIFESKSVAKAKEPMMGSSDPVTIDMFVYNNTKHNPNATAIIGHDLVTGEFQYPSQGIEILNMNPKNLTKINKPEPSTSLAFFKRPTLSDAQLLAGATKWERNFKPKWHVANYPGYLLKGLMKGSLLEKQLSKNGTININLLNAYFNKASQIEREVANKVLAEKFAGLKTIDYNLFKKAVLDELIGNYNRNYNALSMIPTMTTEKMMAYGGDRLGIIKDFKDIPDGTGGLVTTWTEELPVLFKQFTFETPKISIGNRKHYSGQPIGHTRTFTNQQEPLILHVMESQSDWAQKSLGLTKAEKTAIQNIDKQLKTGTPTGFSTLEELQVQKQAILDRASQRTQGISYLSLYLHDNYLQRQLQENLRYAAENGLTKMRYPTSETAAKIEGYLKVNHTLLNELSNLQMKLGELFENGEISWEEYDRMIDAINKLKKELFGKEYDPKHQTILKKYADFPKLFLKLFKDLKVRTVTDAKGNTWYEVDVPKGYLSREWQFKQGGKMNILEFLKNGSGIHIKEKNKGKFTSYCGGKVTDECIRKAKASGNPTLVKRATFALNARRWKHKEGGKVFVSGVSILDSNPSAYKYVKKKLKKHLEGGKTSTWLKIGNFLNSDTEKGVIGLGSLIFNGLKTGLDVANFSNSFDLATDSRVKAMESKMREISYLKGLLKAKEFIALKQLENPDIKYGEVDLMNLALNFSNEFYDSDAIEDYKTQRAQEKFQSMLAIQGSAGGSMNWLDSLGGIASSVLNNNSNTGRTSSTTVLPKLTTNKYTSSTSLSNPVLGNNALGYMPDWTFLLNSSKPK